jgi:serine O-acetyltransferase
VALHRLASLCRRNRLLTLSRALVHVGRLMTGIEIGAGAVIGRNLRIRHSKSAVIGGMDTVIGDHSRIGDDCSFFHGVTIGTAGPGSGMPTIGDRVIIYAGAVVMGSVTIGDDAVIAADAVVTHDVPAGATVGGVPAEILKIAQIELAPDAFVPEPDGSERLIADVDA